MEFYKKEYVKARKPHTCEFCGAKIEANEEYSYESGKYDGEFFTRKLCIPCSKLLTAFCNENGYDEFEYSWVTDWLRDEFCEKCSSCRENPEKCQKIREKIMEDFI